MKIRALVATGLLVLCTSTFAADEPKKKEMTAEQKAEMEAMMKAMTPGEQHKLLDGMVGTFDTKITMWMEPGGEPQTSIGTSVNSWVMGNCEVMQKATGSFMGQPFEGVGYTGYDNVKKQYWGTWIDNFGTGVMISTGSTSD